MRGQAGIGESKRALENRQKGLGTKEGKREKGCCQKSRNGIEYMSNACQKGREKRKKIGEAKLREEKGGED